MTWASAAWPPPVAIGFLARSYGLTIDHVRGAEVVLADGRIVRADAGHESDLFWALPGAGANMGVVASFDIESFDTRQPRSATSSGR